jgi:hypothetical protein
MVEHLKVIVVHRVWEIQVCDRNPVEPNQRRKKCLIDKWRHTRKTEIMVYLRNVYLLTGAGFNEA